MSPEQHAKVLEAETHIRRVLALAEKSPKINRAVVLGNALDAHLETVLEALSIMRAEGVGDDALDAERYRTIRSQNWSDGEFCVVMRPRENVRLGALCPSGAQLDDLVDAAAIRQQPTSEPAR